MEYIKCKYQLYKDETFFTTILPQKIINTKYINVSLKGIMRIKKSWAWDGCSGPTIDESWNQRGGCGHDGLYWLIRNNYLPKSIKSKVDKAFYDWLLMDIEIITNRKKYSKSKFIRLTRKINRKLLLKRAKYYYWGVRKFGNPSIDPKNKRRKITAP